MGLEMEEEEDAKQIVAVGAGTEEERWMGLLGVCFRVERERVTCVAIQGVLLRGRTSVSSVGPLARCARGRARV